MIRLLKELFPQLETSGVLGILKESEISYGLDTFILKCNYVFFIGHPNNFRSENTPISYKLVFEKPFSGMTQNNRPPRRIMLICDITYLSYVKNESQ